jgi:ribonuclease-3
LTHAITPGFPAKWLRDRLEIVPREMALFEAAFTHRSAPGRINNERLEFLGDAVLNLLAAELLYQRFPTASEGDLSRLRARLVSTGPLAEAAQSLGLGDELRLGSGELKTGGFRRESILADALEALIGAVYLDAGLEAARAVVARFCEPLIDSLPPPEDLKDPKTRLQELLQGRGLALPEYRVEQVSGEPHLQHFSVRCEVPELLIATVGEGSSRRRAEQDAAQRVLDGLTGEVR